MGGGPGFTAVKSGEVIYLIKCKAVNIEIFQKSICFNELPVLYNNKTFYMAPKTHVLQKFGTELDCNLIIPPAFNLDGDWMGMVPHHHEVRKPQMLKPSTTRTWSHKSPEHLMNAGIYTQSTMKAFQQHILFPQEVEAAQKNLIRQSLGYETMDQGLKFHKLIDEQTLKTIIQNEIYNMWGWFTTLGNIVSGLMGILFIIK